MTTSWMRNVLLLEAMKKPKGSILIFLGAGETSIMRWLNHISNGHSVVLVVEPTLANGKAAGFPDFDPSQSNPPLVTKVVSSTGASSDIASLFHTKLPDFGIIAALGPGPATKPATVGQFLDTYTKHLKLGGRFVVEMDRAEKPWWVVEGSYRIATNKCDYDIHQINSIECSDDFGTTITSIKTGLRNLSDAADTIINANKGGTVVGDMSAATTMRARIHRLTTQLSIKANVKETVGYDPVQHFLDHILELDDTLLATICFDERE